MKETESLLKTAKTMTRGETMSMQEKIKWHISVDVDYVVRETKRLFT